VQETLADLKRKFDMVDNKKDKYLILTSTPYLLSPLELVRTFGCTLYQARKAFNLRLTEGAFSYPVPSDRPGMSEETKFLVKRFYLMDDNSRPLPGIRGARYVIEGGVRTQVARRWILMTLEELFQSFVQTHKDVKIGRSSFAKLKPINCKWPGQKGHHVQCTCIVHENFKLMLQPLLGYQAKLADVLPKLVCDVNNASCMFMLCTECPADAFYMLTCMVSEDEMVKYNQWATTDRADLKTVQVLGAEYVQDLQAYIPKILQHQFIAKQQQNFVKKLKDELDPGNCVIQMDFAENYTCIIQDAVQGYRWSNIQVTMHAFYVTFFNRNTNRNAEICYGVISDDLSHSTNSVQAFTASMMVQLRRELNIQFVHYVSDGCAG
jgi:hypothetical protein